MLGQPSPPALSISSRTEQVSTLHNSIGLFVRVLTLIFCPYKPCERVTFSHGSGAHPVLKEGASLRICLTPTVLAYFQPRALNSAKLSCLICNLES